MDGSLLHLHNSNMSRPTAPPRAAARLPTYALYGEPQQRHATEALHVERIAERSQRHDWEIQAHRHALLFQILHLQSGAAAARLDAAHLTLAGPCALLVPALLPHGFVFAPQVQGTVITVQDAHLQRLLRSAPALAASLMRGQCLAWPAGAPAAAAVQAAVDALQAAYAEPGAWRDVALDAALLALAVALGRQARIQANQVNQADQANQASHADRPAGTPAPAPAAGARAQGHVQRFRALVDARFRQQPALAALAAELGITPTQLNRVCHQVLGHSALGVLHGRLLLEAQRDLAYTALSIKQIAGGLGFADAGYFSRFFQRHAGCAPSAWRQRRPDPA